MGKIYLKKVKEEVRNSCHGCHYYKNGIIMCDNKSVHYDNLSKICYIEKIIFKQVFPEDKVQTLPRIGRTLSTKNESVIEDREISYTHKTYDGPGAQGCYHNLPPYETTGMSGIPRTGNKNMLTCHVCKQVLPKEDFKKVIVDAPGQYLFIAYACRTCGTIRLKTEDLKD